MTYHDTEMGSDKIQSTMRSMYLDGMSRHNEKRRGIAGRGTAMAVESACDISHIMCYNCREEGYFKSVSPAFAKAREGGTAATAVIKKTRSNRGTVLDRSGPPSTTPQAPTKLTVAHRENRTIRQVSCTPQLPPPDGIKEDSSFDCGSMWMASTGGRAVPSQATHSTHFWLTSMSSLFTEKTTWASSETA